MVDDDSLPALRFGPQVCGALDHPAGGGSREWLVADGTGGYATGTVAGLRTRRYHGLLVVAGPDGSRTMGLTALDAALTLSSGAEVKLATHEWESGAHAPAGHRYLERFELVGGLPRWRWRIGEVVLERELAMLHGSPSLAVVHRLVSAPSAVTLSLTALVAWRPADEIRRAGDPPRVTQVADGVTVEDAFRLAGPGWRSRGEWWQGAFLREEMARGLPATEDLWCAGGFTTTLAPGEVAEVSAWAGDLSRRPPRATVVLGVARRRARAVVAAAKPTDRTDALLALAADQFVVKGPDVIAGYPWHGTWTRDSMASYEGLFLGTGRAVEGAALLHRQAGKIAGRRVDDVLAPEEGVDGPLWFVHAVDRHVHATGDTHLASELLGTLDAVIAGYEGPEHTFRAEVDPADNLLAIGHADAAATWMNARRDGLPVTPRDGKPVELNALWVNALSAVARLRERCGADAADLWSRHDLAHRSFGKRFGAPTGWLYDVVDAPPGAYPLGGDEHHDDPVLRPNQLFAYALPYAPIDPAEPRAVRAVGAALLTSLGLRSLAPSEYGYRGSYGGPEPDRDEAYHQGTVWPHLIGAYVDACRSAGLPSTGLLTGLETHLEEWGLGSISEVADGDAPHQAGGCPFSARSVAELIRARARLSR
ncbi:glycogen debranching protein [Virgisporangium aliadipatigenens]|uniref:Glycogen debranching protein n=2 Tax=Virgisporangium aliadipatigenens TaxID=741659 RepID=A0A8J3YXG7_9ACTN|nr:glycogen debranching protein [Virgisporangium aliadipatigenens]